MAATITLTGATLTCDDVVAAARGNAHVAPAPEVAGRLDLARGAVADAVARGEPVYGLTTGLGANVGLRLEAGEIAAFQERILVGRAVAVGPTMPAEIVRAALLIRANGL